MHFSDQCVSLHSIIFSHLAEVIHEVQSWSHQFYFLLLLKIEASIHHTSRLKNVSGISSSSSSSSLPILSLVRHMHLAEDKKNTRKLEI